MLTKKECLEIFKDAKVKFNRYYSVVAESPPFQRWDECVDKFISINT